MMAIKEININKISSQKDNVVQSFKNEIDVLSKLHHKNIIKYYGAYEKGDKLNILLEYCIAGSLYKLLEVYHHFKENIIRKFTFQILKGIEYLHSHHIMHRDIKAGNILIDKHNHIYLIDFGLSSILGQNEETTGSMGTITYAPPEMYSNKTYSYSIDVWSMGVVLYYLYYGVMPFSKEKSTPYDVIENIRTKKLNFDIESADKEEKKMIRVIKKCLVRDMKMRITAEEVSKMLSV